METDPATLLIVIIASSTFLVPIVYFEYYQKRAAKKFAAAFKKISAKNSLNLSQYDVWGDQYAIGIDSAAKKMMYHSRKNGQAGTVLEDLREVKRCRIVNEDTLIKTQDGDRRIPARIDLQLDFLSPGKKPVSLEFFKRREGDDGAGAMLLAEKWAKIISSKMRNS
jgi:ribosomal protein L21E